MSSADYDEFLAAKAQLGGEHGFAPLWLPGFLFDFQRALVEWAVRKGRAAIFADCGMGKGPIALVWAENVARKTGRPVLFVTPLAVGAQIVREAEKFGVRSVARSQDGSVPGGARIVVTNYERLDRFRPADFGGCVGDESSRIKHMDTKSRALVTEFLRTLPYRLLCTATAAPNDYIELGTHSEALGDMGQVDMLTRFFKNDQNTVDVKTHAYRTQGGSDRKGWRFKGHSEMAFWRWVCSWARACRRPSDLGFQDGRFVLPPLEEREHVVKARTRRAGMLFDLAAQGFHEEREERRRTVRERCEKAAELVAANGRQSLLWCSLNAEGDLLEEMIPGAEQVSGSDSDEAKEKKLLAFADGKIRALVSKQKIAGLGLNLQSCSHIITFPTYSYEQHYQGVRRCWRFGQVRPVVVDIVLTEGEREIMAALKRKAAAADRMFTALVECMNQAQAARRDDGFPLREEVPSWLSRTR